VCFANQVFTHNFIFSDFNRNDANHAGASGSRSHDVGKKNKKGGELNYILGQKLNAEAQITLVQAKTLPINEEASLRHERMLNRQNPFYNVNRVHSSKWNQSGRQQAAVSSQFKFV